ncbi:putative amino acid transporter [Thozetella sp. PMI_491]|nr:putative amino acid transporter [Thozetella sp. PMI_491]
MAETEQKRSSLDVRAVPEPGNDHVYAASKLGEEELEAHEVFRQTSEGVQFRTVSWQRASFIFLKITFSLGILSIPTALYSLGAVGGALSIVGWQIINTYLTFVQGDFRNRHPECHTLIDMCYKLGGAPLRELCGLIFLVGYILVVGSGITGLSVAFNALSEHSLCTVWWNFIALIIVTICALPRTMKNMGWVTMAGFISLFVAILIVVIGVTTRSRPAAAPETGDFELGYYAIAYPDFVAGMTATATIFISTSGSSAFLPVISEMRRPREYKKAVIICMAIVFSCYLSFSLVVYRWCGAWIANPSLGSAGNTLKKVSYGIALIGLIASTSINQHVAAKYVFVRVLRDSHHLQENTVVHWVTWVGCVVVSGVIAFILAESIAIFSYLLALAGSLCFAPMALIIPGFLYLYDYKGYRSGTVLQKAKWYAHCFVPLLGAFITVGGTYAAAKSIQGAYASGTVGSAFSCADNSNTVAG